MHSDSKLCCKLFSVLSETHIRRMLTAAVVGGVSAQQSLTQRLDVAGLPHSLPLHWQLYAAAVVGEQALWLRPRGVSQFPPLTEIIPSNSAA